MSSLFKRVVFSKPVCWLIDCARRIEGVHADFIWDGKEPRWRDLFKAR